MAEPRVSMNPNRALGGVISRIRLENFMCHSNLEIEFGDWVNFITGQNGSGKSAILTALCVAFGSRARGTQRANSMKDFIKNGCSYALVQVEIKNRGEEAFKPELYGDTITVERRVTESTSSIALKNSQGKKVAGKKDDLHEVVVHFNIDVENPCVIMTQDKSREFLHSGNAKDKFKFFFKATLLQQVDDLLKGIERQLNDAKASVDHLEDFLRPALKEVDELQEKIKSMEFVEEMSQQIQILRKKLAWSLVYDTDRKLKEQQKIIEKLQGRIPSCQARIDEQTRKMEELTDLLAKKRSRISHIMERTSEVQRKKEDLHQNLSMAVKERLGLENEETRRTRQIHELIQKVKLLEEQRQDFHDQCVQNTQAEENELEEKLRNLQAEIDEANMNLQRLTEEEDKMTQRIALVENEIANITSQLEDMDRSHRELSSRIRDLHMNQRNKVTAFGGAKVTSLLQTIERHQHRFIRPPIGPIGAHVKLEQGETWSLAVESAIGKVLNAFIVTDHKDSLTLRACAREAHYGHLQIIIYDFSRSRINIPRHMLPQTNHPTVFSVINSDNPTVLNVLVDVAGAERLVLVENYDVGKTVTFDQRISNLKEVYTSDGYKMFSRGSAQTILPPNKNVRAGRLCGSFDKEIKYLERKAAEAKETAQEGRGIKHNKEEELRNLQEMWKIAKRRRTDMEREYRSKEFKLQDVKKSLATEEANLMAASTVDELRQEISKLNDVIQEKETFLEKLKKRVTEAEAKAKDLETSFKKLSESTKLEVEELAKAEHELVVIEKDLNEAAMEKQHYENVMNNRVLADIKAAHAEYQELEHKAKVDRDKASVICLESEVEALGGCKESNPEQLSAQFTRMRQRFERESQRFPESIDDLRILCEKKERKTARKRQTYKAFREKLDACEKALQLRWNKFQRNATLLKRQLTWQFNGHLKKKGISGQIKVSYEDQTLSVEVKMPQDSSDISVRDTRGLSGGERSFSTLCFALALHEMTEAPFRAMDEFDVFMDAVSRKISLDTVVDFALAQGSQWIFITPHDISMVKNDERIKKQQMAAPRG